MPGGLLQLVALGAENIYLTGNPQITYFKVVYRRYTNFSMEDFTLFFDGQPMISSSETTFKCTIPRHGDLLYKTYIVFDIPDIYVNATKTDSGQTSTSGIETEIKKFKWIKNIGTNIIKNISISIGNQEIDNHSGEFIYLWHEMNLPTTEKQIFYEMIGFNPSLYDPAVAQNVYPFSIGGNSTPSVPGRTIIVPLCFWYNRNPGLSIPLIALQYQSVEIKVTFRPVNEIFVVADVPAYYTEGLPPVSSDNELVYRSPKNLVDVDIKDYLVGDNRGNTGDASTVEGWILNLSLLANYIFLETSERRIFTSQSHQYLIEKTIEEEFLGVIGSESLLLKWFHPTKYIMFRCRRSDVNMRNDWTNYTNFKDETLTELEFYNRYNGDKDTLGRQPDDNRWYPVKSYIQTQMVGEDVNWGTQGDTGISEDRYNTNQYTGGSIGNGLFGIKDESSPITNYGAIRKTNTLGINSQEWVNYNDDDTSEPITSEYTGGQFLSSTINPFASADPAAVGFTDKYPYCAMNGSALDINAAAVGANAPEETFQTAYFLNFYKDIKGKRVLDGLVTSDNFKHFKKEILQSATFEFNGMERFGVQPSYYFNLIQPLSYGFQASLFGVYVYSFSLFPLKYEPSGACNMSRLNKIQLKVTTIQPTKPRSIRQVDENSDGSFTYDIGVFGVQYNILRIMGGMGGIVFGN